MNVLGQIHKAGFLSFLCTMLGLEFADSKIDECQIRVVDSVVHFKTVSQKARTASYVAEQKARRIRIAFESLSTYLAKPNRNAVMELPPQALRAIGDAIAMLETLPPEYRELDRSLHDALGNADDGASLRPLLRRLPAASVLPPQFRQAQALLEKAMSAVAGAYGKLWDDARYARGNDLE
jgi:transposase